MKTTIISIAIAALLLGGAAIAQPGGGRADANGDGSLSRAEFTARIDKRFARLDADGNGAVTADERGARKALRGKTAGAKPDRVARRFAQIDTNDDGMVTLAEMQAADAGRAARKAARGGQAKVRGLGRVDADRNGVISRTEFQARALTRFARLDTNRDGLLARAERQVGKASRSAR